MPKAKKAEFYESICEFIIFVFLEQQDERCYVWKTKNSNLKGVYEMHYFLGVGQTKEIFQRGKGSGRTPEMYILETIETTENVALKHCIAWTRYFTEHGYESINRTINHFSEHLAEDTKTIYRGIKDRFLTDVCDKEHQCFADYGTIRKKRTENDRRQIAISLAPDEYQQIADKAKELRMRPTGYVKEMTLNGTVFREDYSFFMEYKETLWNIEICLKNLLLEIYNTGKYHPEDLTNIQKLCDQIGDIHHDAMKEFNKVCSKRKKIK